MRLVRVVTSTRSFFFTRSWISPERSSTCPETGRTSTSGSMQPRRANELLDDDALRLARARTRPASPTRRSRWRTWSSNSSNLSGPVVERARQAEAVLDERLFARAVAAVHRLQLRHGLVRLVDDDEEVLREVVDERRRRLARLATREVARVVLDAVAEAHLLHHLEVVQRALLEPLLLEEAPRLVEEVEPLAQLYRGCSRWRDASAPAASRSASRGRWRSARACPSPGRAAGRPP